LSKISLLQVDKGGMQVGALSESRVVAPVAAGAVVVVGLGATGAVADSLEATVAEEGDSGVNGLEASDTAWSGDGGVALQQSWVRCADGKAAIGGGFARADEGAAAWEGLQIVTSSPAQIDANGNVVSITGGPGFTPIEGDAVGSYVPNGWVVEGFNNGLSDVTVRPYVVCAEVEAAAEKPEEPAEPEGEVD
jgi:hypothetical protein